MSAHLFLVKVGPLGDAGSGVVNCVLSALERYLRIFQVATCRKAM